MKAFFAGVAIACCAFAARAEDAWFNLFKEPNGYLAGGKLRGKSWATRIPGKELKTADPGGGRIILIVDGIPIHFTPVLAEGFGRDAPDPIAAQKKYEQDFQKQWLPGVKFTDDDFCTRTKLPHGGWVAEVPPPPDWPPPGQPNAKRTPYQVLVTFQVADAVVMIGSVYGDEDTRKAVAEKLDAICASFETR